MSNAGPAPPNPGAPKARPNVQRPNAFLRRPGLIVTTLALGTAAYLYMNKPPTPHDEPFVTARTTGVKNIEKAYTNAGATPTHTKAYGGTTQGDKDSVHIRDPGTDTSGSAVLSGGSGQGRDGSSPHKKEGYGDDQRSGTRPKAEQILNQTMYDTPKGK